jgi:DNA-binding transcriptional LysR family regulator
MSKFDQIFTFMAVVEGNSFAQAGRQLGISTAAVSKQITSLEKNLGVELLHRTTRRLELSEAGRLYFDHCKKLMAEMEEAERLVSTIRAEPRGNLGVVSGEHFAFHYIIPYLKEFVEHYPLLQLNLEIAERIPDIHSEKIDLVVGYSISGPPSSVQRKVAATSYVLCGSPSYFSLHGFPEKPADLTGHQYLTHSQRRPDDLLIFNDGTQIHLKPLLKINDALGLVQCALNGLGIIKVHHYMVAEFLKAGALVEVLSRYKEQEIPLYIYYQESRHLQPKIRHFIEVLLSKIALIHPKKPGLVPFI